jgi:hypothetical protein
LPQAIHEWTFLGQDHVGLDVREDREQTQERKLTSGELGHVVEVDHS